MISHQVACRLIGISSMKLHKVCELGVGPKRTMSKDKKQWVYDKESVENFKPVDFCRTCKTAIQPGTGWFCSEECKKAFGVIRSEQIKEQPARKKYTAMYRVQCPICKKYHTVKSKLRPDHWVYCKNHAYRRSWDSGTCERMAVAL